MEPVYIALGFVGTAITGLAGYVFRSQEQRLKSMEADRDYWREHYLLALGLAQIATGVAEKKRRAR